VNVTSANFAGNGGSVVDGEGEAPGVGVAVVASAFGAEPAVSFEDLFWQADVKMAAEIAVAKTNRKIIFYCSLFFLKKSLRVSSSQVSVSLSPVTFSPLSSTSGGSA
jgi:hypothetical protein